MSLLRIYASLHDTPQQCQWALISDGREPVLGQGALTQLPQRAERVQLVLPAAEVLITRAKLPQSAKRHAGSVLAFAVEEETLGDPDANQVSWLGSVADSDVLAVADRQGLKDWQAALEAAGIEGYEVHCETLLLPLAAGEWSLAWDGREGFVRTSEIEGAATDCGDRDTPPLALRLMLDEAKARIEAPKSIALYPSMSAPDAESNLAPDLEAWQRKLGVALRLARPWDWRRAPAEAGVSLVQERQRWRLRPGTLQRLRPAAWLVAIAVAVHALALIADWTRLAGEQRSLRSQMESRFRAAFPDAVAVADPALQMRRKLTDARHAAGRPDSGDFLPMMEKVAAALKDLPAGSLRIASYESGRMTLELAAVDDGGVRRIVSRLLQSGMRVDAAPARAGGSTAVLTVRSS
jgi:general secretion pathway protein L